MYPMDIEELSKAQFILLTILVNFVIAIATSIVTVSLLDQAPPQVTRSVNNIIEHTIQTVTKTQTASESSQNAPQPQSVSDQSALVAAIQSARAHTVVLRGAASSSPVLGHGVYVPAQRAILSAAPSLPAKIMVQFGTGKVFGASLTRANNQESLFTLDASATPQSQAISLIQAQSLQPGQTVTAMQADGAAVTGIVSKAAAGNVFTSLPVLAAGTPVFDLSGNLIGLATGAAAQPLVSADALAQLLTATSTTVATSTHS